MTLAIAELKTKSLQHRTAGLRDTKYQATLADNISIEGVGLHSGQRVKLTIRAAAAGTGIVFTDGRVIVPARADYVVDTSRGTTLGYDGAVFRTIEHVLGALSGMGIDNALIEIEGPEVPAMDGSAKLIAEAIETAGIVLQDEEKCVINIPKPICVQSGDSFILALPANEFSITYVLNYDHPLIGAQCSSYVVSADDFAREMAPARTFVLYEEVAALLDKELARGGNIDNVIVFWQDKISTQLRYEDELVRHKMLDMIGDFTLCGGRLNAEVLAVRSGHRLNVEFAKAVLSL